jgi:DnaJ-class molecular chaperone
MSFDLCPFCHMVTPGCECPEYLERPCASCYATGWVVEDRGELMVTVACPACKGTGRVK